MKSEWKKEIKLKIHTRVESEVQGKCKIGRKTRSIKDNTLEIKQYLKETNLSEASDIMCMRLHMSKLPCNYGIRGEQCPLCGLQGKMETEYYFESCLMTSRIAEIWGVKAEDIDGCFEQVRNAKNHLKKVETLMEQHMILKEQLKHDV